MCCMNIKFFKQEKRVREKPDAIGATTTQMKRIEEPHMMEKFNTRANYTLGISGGTIENPVANCGAREDVSARKLPRKLRK